MLLRFQGIKIQPNPRRKIENFDFVNTVGVSYEIDFFEGHLDGLTEGFYFAEKDGFENQFILVDGEVKFLWSTPINKQKFDFSKDNPLLKWAESQEALLEEEEDSRFRHLW